MRQPWLALVLAAVSLGAGTAAFAAAQAARVGPGAAPPGVAPAALTPSVIVSAPGRYVNQPVEVVIVEPLEGPATAQALASLEYGQVRIRMPDGGPLDLSLVPPAFRINDPDRYKKKFERPLASPLVVRGELLRDEEMSRHRPTYVIRVASYDALPPAAPTVVKTLAEIDADPTAWDRQRIVYEGTYETRFEVSALDERIWLGFSQTTQVTEAPAQRSGKHRVRVTGYLYARPGSRYGHLGGYVYELVADRVEFR